MELHKEFLQLALASGGSVVKGFGVWSFYDLSENMVTWYFSPEAAALAMRFGAPPARNQRRPQALVSSSVTVEVGKCISLVT